MSFIGLIETETQFPVGFCVVADCQRCLVYIALVVLMDGDVTLGRDVIARFSSR